MDSIAKFPWKLFPLLGMGHGSTERSLAQRPRPGMLVGACVCAK